MSSGTAAGVGAGAGDGAGGAGAGLVAGAVGTGAGDAAAWPPPPCQGGCQGAGAGCGFEAVVDMDAVALDSGTGMLAVGCAADAPGRFTTVTDAVAGGDAGGSTGEDACDACAGAGAASMARPNFTHAAAPPTRITARSTAHGSTRARLGGTPADDSTGSGDTAAPVLTAEVTLETLDTLDTLETLEVGPLPMSPPSRGKLPEPAGPRGSEPSLVLPSTFVTDVTSGRGSCPCRLGSLRASHARTASRCWLISVPSTTSRCAATSLCVPSAPTTREARSSASANSAAVA